MQSYWLGLTDYEKALEFSKASPVPSVTGSENHLTLTLGRRASILSEELKANSKPMAICHVDRGGHATLHNPGQLVIYPHLHLPTYSLGVRDYVSLLGRTTVQVLNSLGLQTECVLDSKVKEPGIYSNQGKIAFIGVRVQKGVTSHGLSLNVCNELSDFDGIRSCSVWEQPMASLKSHGILTTPEHVFSQWTELFSEAFSKSFRLTPKAPLSNVSDEEIKGLRV